MSKLKEITKEEILQNLEATKTFNYNVYFGEEGSSDCQTFERCLEETSDLILNLISQSRQALLKELRTEIEDGPKYDELSPDIYDLGDIPIRWVLQILDNHLNGDKK